MNGSVPADPPLITGAVFAIGFDLVRITRPNAGRLFLGLFFIAIGIGVNLMFVVFMPEQFSEGVLEGGGEALPAPHRWPTTETIGFSTLTFGSRRPGRSTVELDCRFTPAGGDYWVLPVVVDGSRTEWLDSAAHSLAHENGVCVSSQDSRRNDYILDSEAGVVTTRPYAPKWVRG